MEFTKLVNPSWQTLRPSWQTLRGEVITGEVREVLWPVCVGKSRQGREVRAGEVGVGEGGVGGGRGGGEEEGEDGVTSLSVSIYLVFVPACLSICVSVCQSWGWAVSFPPHASSRQRLDWGMVEGWGSGSWLMPSLYDMTSGGGA